jgi:hypothetical protein
MSSLPKTGTLDRQAGVPRVALRFSTTRNPASIGFNYPTRGESTKQVHLRYRTGTPLILLSFFCFVLVS